MYWLDSHFPADADTTKPGIALGRCDRADGDPKTVESAHPDASVIYSNIKVSHIALGQPGPGNLRAQEPWTNSTLLLDWHLELNLRFHLSFPRIGPRSLQVITSHTHTCISRTARETVCQAILYNASRVLM